jgi:hypothetical protein
MSAYVLIVYAAVLVAGIAVGALAPRAWHRWKNRRTRKHPAGPPYRIEWEPEKGSRAVISFQSLAFAKLEWERRQLEGKPGTHRFVVNGVVRGQVHRP